MSEYGIVAITLPCHGRDRSSILLTRSTLQISVPNPSQPTSARLYLGSVKFNMLTTYSKYKTKPGFGKPKHLIGWTCQSYNLLIKTKYDVREVLKGNQKNKPSISRLRIVSRSHS